MLDSWSDNCWLFFEKVNFRQVNRWDTDDALGRSDRRWATQLFVLENPTWHKGEQLNRY